MHMLSLAALSLSAAGFFASSATLSRTADAGRAGTPISLANAVTNGMLPGSKFCLNVKLLREAGAARRVHRLYTRQPEGNALY